MGFAIDMPTWLAEVAPQRRGICRRVTTALRHQAVPGAKLSLEVDAHKEVGVSVRVRRTQLNHCAVGAAKLNQQWHLPAACPATLCRRHR